MGIIGDRYHLPEGEYVELDSSGPRMYFVEGDFGGAVMRDLYTTVVRHLKSQRDSAADLKLWDDLWRVYERSGAEGVAKTIDQIIELPDTGDEKQS